MSLYLDTSVLVSWLVPDTNSAQADALLANETQLIVSDLTMAEVANALIRRRKQGRYSAAVVMQVMKKLDTYVDAGYVLVEPLPRSVFIEARLLAERVPGHLRTGDALHLVMAKRLNLPVATFDVGMRAAVIADGIAVRPE